MWCSGAQEKTLNVIVVMGILLFPGIDKTGYFQKGPFKSTCIYFYLYHFAVATKYIPTDTHTNKRKIKKQEIEIH